MARCEIFGSSDDLVEVDGDHSEEWSVWDGEAWVVLSTGDRFGVQLVWRVEQLVWRVEHIIDTGKLSVRIERAPAYEDADEHPSTDRAEVSGDFEWVDCWETWPPSPLEVMERIESEELLRDALEKGERLLRAYDVLKGRV